MLYTRLMTPSTHDVLDYYLKSLLDAELPDVAANLEFGASREDLSKGYVDFALALRILKRLKVDNKVPQQAEVNLCPYIFKIKSGGKSKAVVPLLIPALLDQEGRLEPPGERLPWIPRRFLEPSAKGQVALGSVSAFEALQIDAPESSVESEKWQTYYAFALSLLPELAGETWQDLFEAEGYHLSDYASLVVSTEVVGAAQHIYKVYKRLKQFDGYPRLVERYTKPGNSEARAPLEHKEWQLAAHRHLASFGGFALSSSQRNALHQALVLPEGEFLTISGPPGTGKTSLLKSLIASRWVTAAIAGAEPPVIVVSSTNNQAIENVLESLKGATFERWLPHPVNSFGLFLASNTQADKLTTNRQADKAFSVTTKRDDRFVKEIETTHFVTLARTYYLKKCKSYFGEDLSLENALAKLEGRLQARAALLHGSLNTARALGDFRRHSNPNLDEEAASSSSNLEAVKLRLNKCESLKQAWYTFFLEEAPGFLGFLPFVRKRWEAKQALFWSRQDLLADSESDIKQLEAFATQLKTEVGQRQKAVEDLKAVQCERDTLEGTWLKLKKHLGVPPNLDVSADLETPAGKANPHNLHNWLDGHLRPQLFELATHYFEGRWLKSIEESGVLADDYKSSQREAVQKAKWRRYALLSPCMVTTTHSGPAFFDYFQTKSKPLFEFIDLLVFDESGQIAPQIAVGMLALAKQALVVGDSKQLEPVTQADKGINRLNLHHLSLSDAEAEDFEALGQDVFDGSVMKIAQHASFVQPKPGEGVFLAEHYRCVPSIIAYCNDLAYSGRLKPRRDVLENHPWPHMGYFHIKGKSSQTGGDSGSRFNEREAKTLVNWIVQEKDKLLGHYKGLDLSEIIGIVTPFKAQAKRIKDELKKAKLGSIEKVGTVHTLQGAERPIVLFSPVYTSLDAVSYFYDQGVNMLNVTVSRAKDSFIVIGDMDIFDPQAQTPSGLLARHLFGEGKEIVELEPAKRTSEMIVDNITTLERHCSALRQAFNVAKENLVIVSPFLSHNALATDQLMKRLASAVRKGVKVTVYTDDGFNKGQSKAQKAAEQLRTHGAELKICHNIHSKTICIDDSVLIEGSFNWLSASRNPDFARYERSLIYKGENVTTFIEEVVTHLEARVVDVSL